MWKRLAVLLIVLWMAVPTFAAPLRVVAAGDSITNGYAYQRRRLQTSFEQISSDASVLHANYSGAKAQQWIDLGKLQATLDHDPDVVVLMLGTNDAIAASWGVAGYDQSYYNAMTTIFDTLDAFTNGRGHSPHVLLMNLIPIIDHAGLASSIDPVKADAAIDNQLNPWLTTQAADRGYTLFDTHALITTQPDWQSFYNDGVHLWGADEQGYYLMADHVASNVVAMVPEPATLTLLGVGLLGFTRKRR